MPQCRVDFGCARRGLEDVIVTHTLLLRQFHWQKQERRVYTLFRDFLEIVPAKKAEDEAQLSEAVLGAVAPSFADYFVQDTRNIQCILKSKVLAERQWRGLSNRSGKSRVPDAELLQLDIPVVQHERHRGLGKIQSLKCRLEVEEPIAPRDLEEAVAQMRLDHPALACQTRFPKTFDAVEIEIGCLFAIVFKPRDDLPEILRAPVSIQLRHLYNHRREHRVQAPVYGEQIRAICRKHFELAGIREIETAGQACQQKPQRKDIHELVVMPDGMLPGAVARQKHGFRDSGVSSPNGEVGNAKRGFVDVQCEARLPHYLHGSAHRRLKGINLREVLLYGRRFVGSESQI